MDDLRDEGVGDARTRSLGELEGVAQLLYGVGAATAVPSVELKTIVNVSNSYLSEWFKDRITGNASCGT